MADTFKFELVSPEEKLFPKDEDVNVDAVEVTVPGTEGDFGVLAHHASVISMLRPGMVVAKFADGQEKSYFVRGGFADVSVNGLILIADYAVSAADFNAEAMQEQLRLAGEAVEEATEANREKAQNLLNQLNEVSATLAA